MDRISFVIPCFNNAENVDDLFYALLENEKQFSGVAFEYVMVDDASEDRTYEILTTWQKKLPDKLRLLQLRKNIGSHKAVFKGLNMATGDCVIVMAADLQDPPKLSFELIRKWEMGSKLVLAIKNNSLSVTSKLFHWIMRTFFVKSAPYGAFDYALFDKYLIPKLQNKSVKNCNLFYRLVDLQPNFSYLIYTKQERKKGKSGWTFTKKLFFFSENISSYFISSIGILK
ncbi:MAG: glycosyltransferase [Bacteroidia bacterium]